MIMYNTILNTKLDIDGSRGLLSLKFLPNTILTIEIISIFTQEFYDQVISLTNSTYHLVVKVTMADGRIYAITLGQWVNKTVPLSELVDIICCFRGVFSGNPPHTLRGGGGFFRQS